MKVLVVTNRFPSLSTPFILNLVTGLVEQGVGVTVVSLEKAEQANQHATYYQYKARFNLHEKPPVPAAYWQRLLFLFDCLLHFLRYDPALAGLCLRSVFRGRYGLSLRYLYDIRFYASLKGFDLAHAQFGPIGADLINLKLDKVIRYPVITHFRGYDIQRIFRFRPVHLYDKLFSKGDFFIANCEYFRNRIIQMGAPANKTVVLYSGIDEAFFIPSETIQRRTDPYRIQLCSVGRLTGKKGLAYSIRAIHRCKEMRPNIQFHFSIIGEGELQNELEELVHQLGLTQEVVFLGARNHSFILEFLQTQDIFLSHNIRTADGDEDAPVNVIKEAFLVKLPVVATWHGGIPELVQDGVSGLLVQEKDVEAMAACILRLVDTPELSMQLGEAGYRIVHEKFTNAIINKQLLAIYNQVLKLP